MGEQKLLDDLRMVLQDTELDVFDKFIYFFTKLNYLDQCNMSDKEIIETDIPKHLKMLSMLSYRKLSQKGYLHYSEEQF